MGSYCQVGSLDTWLPHVYPRPLELHDGWRTGRGSLFASTSAGAELTSTSTNPIAIPCKPLSYQASTPRFCCYVQLGSPAARSASSADEDQPSSATSLDDGGDSPDLLNLLDGDVAVDSGPCPKIPLSTCTLGDKDGAVGSTFWRKPGFSVQPRRGMLSEMLKSILPCDPCTAVSRSQTGSLPLPDSQAPVSLAALCVAALSSPGANQQHSLAGKDTGTDPREACGSSPVVPGAEASSLAANTVSATAAFERSMLCGLGLHA